MSHACSGEPVSWLRLERYHLGELPEREHREVDAHLHACESCRESLFAIKQDERQLPPLPEVAPRASWFPQLTLRWMPAVAAAAAATLLVVFLVPGDEVIGTRPARMTWKGGDLAIALVRDRNGAITEDPQAYLPGDRFQVLVTCPGDEPTSWDVALFQSGDVFFPFAAPQTVRCGNRVTLPGAFRLTGNDPATVCLLVGPGIPDRDTLVSMTPAGLPEAAVCAMVEAR